MRVDSTKLKHIVVSVDNYRWLKSLGQAADSFDQVITELRATVVARDDSADYTNKRSAQEGDQQKNERDR